MTPPDAGPVPVVVDTNALLLPFTDGTDIEDELTALLGAFELVVPQPVIDELVTLQQDGGKTGQAARAAGAFLARCRVEATKLPGDDGVLDVARRLQGVVLSNDKAVQGEAARAGLRVVSSRGHGRLQLSDF